MSTRSVLTVVGGVVGAYFGYPQLGLLVGSLVGGAVDPQRIEGPQINETGVQTSAEGVQRPIIWGTIDVVGNIMHKGPSVKTTTEESQGKGGGSETTVNHLSRSYAIRICEGPIGGLLRIWADNKLVYDVRAGTGMAAESTQWIANKIIYLGDETQLPDPTLVAIDADAPSHRGTAYIVFILEDLTDRAGSIPQYRFEVAKELEPPEVHDITGNVAVPVYSSAGNPVYDHVHLNHKVPGDDGSVQVGTCMFNAWNGTTQPSRLLSYDDGLNIVATSDILMNTASYAGAVPSATSDQFPFARYGSLVVGLGTSYALREILYLSAGGSLMCTLVPDASAPINWFASNTPFERNGIQRYMWLTQSHFYFGVRRVEGVDINKIYIWANSNGFPSDFRVNAIVTISGVCATPGNHFLMSFGRDNVLRVINDVGLLSNYEDTGGFIDSETLPFTTTNMTAFAFDNGLAAFSYATGSGILEIRRVADWSLLATYTNSVLNSKPLGNRMIFTDDSLFIQCQDTLLRAEYTGDLVGEPAILADIVSDIYDRCGADGYYDVTELTDEVDGFVCAGAYTGADAISKLIQGYWFDISGHDKKNYHPKRGAAVIETLTIDDLLELPDTNTREQAIERPKKLHLKYKHAASGYAAVKATAPRANSPDVLTTGEAIIELPAVLDEDQAAKKADVMYKIVSTEVAGETEIVVPFRVGAKYVTGNNLGLVLRGAVTRQRIDRMEFQPWRVKLSLKPDRQSAYTSNLTGVPIPPPELPPSTIIGETQLAVLDIPALRDSEDDLNYYVAVSGRLPPWYGARYQRSLDGGATWVTVADITTASIMGEITAAVADASEDYTDTTNSVTVELYREGQSLESISDAQFLSEGNGFALEKADGSWEIMQFRDAVQNSDGTFTVSHLNRGRLNSGTSDHGIGARFVMLQRPMHIAAESAWIGQDVTHRAISLGQSADDTTNDITQTYVGRSQIEWPVVDLVAVRDSSDLIAAMWTPRFRFGTDDAPVNSVNMTGYRVTIDDGSITSTFDLTTNQFSGFDASGMTPPMTVSVSALNRITGAGPATFDTV